MIKSRHRYFGGRLCEYTIRTALFLYLTILFILTIPYFAGLQAYTVVSGSMEPRIPVGSMIYVQKKNGSEISVGDVITYSVEGMQTQITHRVIGIDEKEKTFRTKGDANEDPDQVKVRWKDVQGKVLYSVPFAGYFEAYLGDTRGMAAAMCILIGLYICLEMCRENNEEEVQRGEG